MQTTGAVNRAGYIDTAKAVGIICVILGHITTIPAELKEYLYSFHMPLFFLCYGLIPRQSKTYTFRTALSFIQRRYERLLVPYFLWALIYSKFSFHNLGYILYGSRQALNKSGSLTSLWFLPSMFISVILFEIYLSSDLHKKRFLRYFLLLTSLAACAILPAMPFGYPWGINVAICAFAFMLIGHFIKNILERIMRMKTAIIAIIFAFCAVLSLCYKLNNPSRGFVLMAHAEYGNFVLFVLAAFWGSCGVILLSMLISKCAFLSHAFQYAGRQTLIIFALHVPINNLLIRVFQPYITHMFLLNTLVLALSLSACVMGAIGINRLFPVLAGNSSR